MTGEDLIRVATMANGILVSLTTLFKGAIIPLPQVVLLILKIKIY